MDLTNIMMTIGTAVTTIVAIWTIMGKKFDSIESRFDKIDAKFDKIDAKFDKIDAKFDKMEPRFDKMEKNFDEIKSELKSQSDRISRIEGMLHWIERIYFDKTGTGK